MTGYPFFKNVWGKLLVDAFSLVADFNDDTALGGARVSPHARGAATVAQRVFDEGGQHLAEFAGVGQDGTLGLVKENQRAAGRRELLLSLLASGVENLEDMDCLSSSPAFALGDVEKF